MKLRLNKSQMMECAESILNEEYPSNWNPEEFSELKSFNSRKEYCEKNLQRISSGSGRIVYKIDDQKVLKLAKNKKGLAQNIVEIDTSNDYYINHLFAEVFESDENGLWVEMELARKVSINRFVKESECSFEDFVKVLKLQKARQPLPNELEHLYENEFVRGFLDYVGDYDVPVGDLIRMSSYGLVNRNGGEEIVLVDFGLTDKVYDSYYA